MASALVQGQQDQTTMALRSETVSQFHNTEVDFPSLFVGLSEALCWSDRKPTNSL